MDGKKMIKMVVLGGLLLGSCLFGVKVQAAADEVTGDFLSEDLGLPPNDEANTTTRTQENQEKYGLNRELYWAVRSKDLTVARELLDEKVVDVNEVFPDGEVYYNGTGTDSTTLLETAIGRRDMEMVKLLMEHGADPHQMRRDRFGFLISPLKKAVRSASLDVVKFLLENGADFHQTYDNNGTLLLAAMENIIASDEWIEIVKLLLDQGLDPNDQNGYGYVPLVQLVIEIIITTRDYFSFFHTFDKYLGFYFEGAEEQFKRINCMLGMLELLVSRGANINVQDDNGSTPLHWAIMPPIPRFGEKNSGMVLAIYKRLNLKLLEKLIELGANVNTEDENGRTPLDLFVLRKKVLPNEYDLEAITLLRRHGAEEGSYPRIKSEGESASETVRRLENEKKAIRRLKKYRIEGDNLQKILAKEYEKKYESENSKVADEIKGDEN
jgi:ankyrin repeat protein